MVKKTRVPRSHEKKLRDLETHLYFLWDARRLYAQEEERYKQVAAELRVLVCETPKNRSLLLKLMDNYDFRYDVQPPGPPFEKQPIPMIGWRDDPVHQRWTHEVAAAMGDEAKMASVADRQAALRRPVPFREYVNQALAVYLAPHDYSYKELTLAIAQQAGSSHEDEDVEVVIAMGDYVKIGGHCSHVAPLIGFADLVLEVGGTFLGFLVKNHGYQSRHFDTVPGA